jgi:hypothetical protein
MLWFNPQKDCGVITMDDGERLDVRGGAFAEGSLPSGRCAGTIVDFRIGECESGPIATDVVVVPFTEPRRARLRRGHR